MKVTNKVIKNSIIGVIDQVFFSITNFLISILLGRWLSEVDYGLYSVTYSLFLILSSVQIGLVFEPMVIFGPRNYRDKIRDYLSQVLNLQLIITFIMGVVICLVSNIWESQIKLVIIGIGVSFPSILLYWFLRQAAYVISKPEIAARSSFLYTILIFFGILFFRDRGVISVFSVFVLMGVSSLISSIPAFYSLRLFQKAKKPKNYLAIIKSHWDYGKWLLISNVIVALSSFAYSPLIGLFVGLENAAIFKANQNLIQPLLQLFMVINLLILPRFTEIASSKDICKLDNEIKRLHKLLIGLVILYFVFLIPFSTTIINLFYGNDLYNRYAYLVPIFAIVQAINILTRTFGTLFRVNEKSKYILMSKFGYVIFLIALGIPLIKYLALNGAVICMLGSTIIEATICCIIFRKHSIERPLEFANQ